MKRTMYVALGLFSFFIVAVLAIRYVNRETLEMEKGIPPRTVDDKIAQVNDKVATDLPIFMTGETKYKDYLGFLDDHKNLSMKLIGKDVYNELLSLAKEKKLTKEKVVEKM